MGSYLKQGEYKGRFPKSKLDSVLSLVESIQADETMLSALPLAFKKKVGERGKFDDMVIEQSETLLTDHLKGLEDRISNGTTIKAGKENEAKDAEKALHSSTEQKESS